jgi:replicative DNA helicase
MANLDDLKDIAAETTVIASLLLHPEFILHTDWLKAKHFSQKENGAIYWAINELYKKGITNIDELNINNQLSSNEGVKELMEKRKLTDISKYMELSHYAARDSLEDYEEFCKTVLNLAYKRTLLDKSGELYRLCFSKTDSLQDTDSKVHHIMSDLTEEYMVSTDLRTIGERADELFAEIIEDQSDERFGVDSKFEILRKYFRYERGECIVLAARMKTGKSAFVLNEAIYQAMKGIPTLIIDTELTDKVWYKRALCHISGVEFRRIRDGHWDKKETEKIQKAQKIIKSLPLVHYYMPVVDMSKTYAMCKLLKYKMDLQFLCFDYIKGDDTDAFALSNKLGQMTNILKNEIAGELDMCVLAACQLNRQNEVASSDKIAAYASTVIRWRFKAPSEIISDGGLKYGNVYAQIYYNRNGEMQDKDEWMSLNFIGNLMTITDCSQPVQAEPFEETG